MALALIRCCIEADQGGTPHVRARVSLVSWEGGSHVVLFMVPLGPRSARPMAQALRLPFEHFTIIIIIVIIIMKSTKVQTLGGNIGTFGLETPICMHMY